MAIKRWVLSLLTAAMVAALAGCGSNTPVQNQPPPPPSNVTIGFSTSPTNPLPLNQTTTIVADVNNDTSNAGVDWKLTCGNADCGKLSALHTDSGATLTYTPPASFPGSSEMVNIVAFATADHTANLPASIQITAFDNSNLQAGNYVFQVQGSDASFIPYQFAGVIHLDGSGLITSGVQTLNFLDASGNFVSDQAAITGGSYFLGPDGRGTITIVPDSNDTEVSTEFLSFVLLSSSHALVAVVPPSPSVSSPASANGTLDLQTTPPPLLHSGGYAFVVNGTDYSQGIPSAIGGILAIDSTDNTISGTGSVADQNLAGVVTAKKKVTGSLSYPDPNPFGMVTFSLSVPLFTSTTDFQFTGYIADDSHIKLIESDSQGLGWTFGQAIAQSAGIDSFTGTYVFGVAGADLSTIPATLTSVGTIDADSSTGYMDTFMQEFPAQVSAAFDASSVVDPLTGRVVTSLSHFSPAAHPAFAGRFFIYLTGTASPALVLAVGNTNYPLVGAGIAYPQSSSLTFGGSYGFSFAQQPGGQETDGTGQMTADSNSAFPLSGIVDNGVATAQQFTGTFTGDPCSTLIAVSGCFPGTLDSHDTSGNGTNAFLTPLLATHFYQIDSDHGFFVETDLVDPNLPTGVVSFGYYARRCDVTDPTGASCQQAPAKSSGKRRSQTRGRLGSPRH